MSLFTRRVQRQGLSLAHDSPSLTSLPSAVPRYQSLIVWPCCWRVFLALALALERVHAFLDRPLAGEWPYLWLDATYLKQREGGRIVSVAAIIAVAVNTDGKARDRWAAHRPVRGGDLLVGFP